PEEPGICYTRTGRRFFGNNGLEVAMLDRIREALDAERFWDEFATDWFLLDCELMPWSAKAQDLIRDQYASVGAAARASLADVVPQLHAAEARCVPLNGVLGRFEQKVEEIHRYVDSYHQYCWPTTSLADYRLAPFHILATEGQ